MLDQVAALVTSLGTPGVYLVLIGLFFWLRFQFKGMKCDIKAVKVGGEKVDAQVQVLIQESIRTLGTVQGDIRVADTERESMSRDISRQGKELHELTKVALAVQR